MQPRLFISGLLALTMALSCSCSDSAKEGVSGGKGQRPGGGSETVVWHSRAYETMQAIDRYYGITTGSLAGLYNEHSPKGSSDGAASFLWPYDGLVSGAACLNALGYDVSYKKKVDNFEKYLSNTNPAGYSSSVNGWGERYYDDNSIVGLNLVEAYRQLGDASYLTRCARIVNFLLSGEDNVFDGGLWWCEQFKNNPAKAQDGSNKPACANSFAQWFLLSYYDVCPASEKANVLAFAKRLYNWTYNTLRDPVDNVYWNDKGADGVIHTTKWTYNSGAMIAAGYRLWKITGEQHYLDEAKATATGAWSYFARNHNGVSKTYPLNDPWFTIKLIKAYIELEPEYPACNTYIRLFISYADSAWEAARQPSGLFLEDWSGRKREASRDSKLLMQDAALESFGVIALYNKEHK